MKANEAPKKVYLQEPTKVRTEKKYDNDIEYIHTNAFIEKACEWLSKHAKKYYFNKDGHYLGTDELIEDFEIAMRL